MICEEALRWRVVDRNRPKIVTYPRILTGKYRIARNVYASCRLDILEEDDEEVRLLLGLRKKADSTVAVGTRILLDEKTSSSPGDVASKAPIQCVSITVKETLLLEGQHVLVCSGIQRENLPERRKELRRKVSFPILLVDGAIEFMVTDGTANGLTLQSATPQNTLTRLIVERAYDFQVRHKETNYTLSGIIRHLQYDWKHYRHRLGVSFPSLSAEHEVILNRMIDPDYTVSISTKQTINTSLGKISPD